MRTVRFERKEHGGSRAALDESKSGNMPPPGWVSRRKQVWSSATLWIPLISVREIVERGVATLLLHLPSYRWLHTSRSCS
jgi:hypothetical protein